MATSSTSISFSSTGRVVTTTATAAWVVATAGASVANTVVDSTILMGAGKKQIKITNEIALFLLDKAKCFD